jgi:hypothetical protein
MGIEFLQLKIGTGQRLDLLTGLPVDELKDVTIVTPRAMMAYWNAEIRARLSGITDSKLPTLLSPTEWLRDPKWPGLLVVDDLAPPDMRRVVAVLLESREDAARKTLVLSSAETFQDAMRHAFADVVRVADVLATERKVGAGIKQSLIEAFDRNGYSVHSQRGETVSVIAQHCREHGIPFRLEAAFIDGRIAGMRVARRDVAAEAPSLSGMEMKVLFDSEDQGRHMQDIAAAMASLNDQELVSRMLGFLKTNPFSANCGKTADAEPATP